jgi:microtubule-associated protein-like 6
MLLSESHSHRELHGLALSPIDADEYVTVGDDGFVRVWSILTLAVKRRVSVDAAGRAVAWSPDGLQLCVGIGGDPAAAARDGSFIILNAKTLETIFEDRKAKKWISDVKYSPEKNFIALASMDGRVYIHDARKYNLVKNIETPNGEPILRVDWSHDAMHIRVGTTARELYVYTTDDLIPSATPALVRDLKWSSNHCPYAWLTKGVWRAPADECGVTSVDVHEKNGLVAVAYQDGQVSSKLFSDTKPATYRTVKAAYPAHSHSPRPSFPLLPIFTGASPAIPVSDARVYLQRRPRCEFSEWAHAFHRQWRASHRA